MRVLIVMAVPPLLEGGAPGRCAVGLMRGLAEHGVDAHAVAAAQYHSGPLPPGLDVELVRLERPESAPQPHRSPRLRRPLDNVATHLLAQRVRELAPDFDLVHLDQAETGACAVDGSMPSLLHIHYRIRLDRPLGPPWRRSFHWHLARARAEAEVVRRQRYLLASSPVVAASLRAANPGKEVAEAPLCLDADYYPAASLDGPPTAGLIGSGTWQPTAAAMSRFASRVWPQVLRIAPDARSLIAGRNTASLPNPAAPGLEYVGEVPSAAEFLRSLSVLLFPLTRGSGMKVKVLEALASGVPVVTTPAGAEGVDAGDGIVVAESDEQLARAAASILLDDAERRERGAAARNAFLARYASGPATLPIVRFYERMLAG